MIDYYSFTTCRRLVCASALFGAWADPPYSIFDIRFFEYGGFLTPGIFSEFSWR